MIFVVHINIYRSLSAPITICSEEKSCHGFVKTGRRHCGILLTFGQDLLCPILAYLENPMYRFLEERGFLGSFFTHSPREVGLSVVGSI